MSFGYLPNAIFCNPHQALLLLQGKPSMFMPYSHHMLQEHFPHDELALFQVVSACVHSSPPQGRPEAVASFGDQEFEGNCSINLETTFKTSCNPL